MWMAAVMQDYGENFETEEHDLIIAKSNSQRFSTKKIQKKKFKKRKIELRLEEKILWLLLNIAVIRALL
jgi:hypothetical protein